MADQTFPKCVCVCVCVCVNERTWAIWDTAGNISRGNAGAVEGHRLELGHALDAALSSWRWDPGRHFPPPRENNLAWHLAPNDGLTLERRRLRAGGGQASLPQSSGLVTPQTQEGGIIWQLEKNKIKIRKKGGFVPCFLLSPGPGRHFSVPYGHESWGQKQQRYVWKCSSHSKRRGSILLIV